MDSHNIMFIVLAVIIVLGSIATVMTKSIVRAATYLLLVLLGTAGVFFLLGYTFLGSVQMMVYAGGIIVLYVFSILLTSGQTEKLTEKRCWKIVSGAILSCVALGIFGTILWLHGFGGEMLSAPSENTLSMQTIGTSLLDTKGYLLPFEAVSVLLLACIVGGLVIARKR